MAKIANLGEKERNVQILKILLSGLERFDISFNFCKIFLMFEYIIHSQLLDLYIFNKIKKFTPHTMYFFFLGGHFRVCHELHQLQERTAGTHLILFTVVVLFLFV
jgi:hypothetical protein